MGLFGPPNVEKLESRRRVKALIRALDYLQSEDVRVAAASALGVIKDPRAVDPLIATLENPGHSWMLRQEATLSLGHVGDVRAVGSLIATLKGGDSNLRFCAACALGEIGDAKALEPLLSSLEDNSGTVRSAVAEALDKLGWKPETEDQEIRYRIANEDWDECVRIGKPAVARLIDILKLDDSTQVADAAKALGEIGDEAAVVPLIRFILIVLVQTKAQVVKPAQRVARFTRFVAIGDSAGFESCSGWYLWTREMIRGRAGGRQFP